MQAFIWPKKVADKKSILSPLNPASSLYPDGIMSTQWIPKHQSSVPVVVLLFCDLWEYVDKDPLGVTMSGLERDHDTIAASEINAVRANALNCGSRLAVVFILKYSSPGCNNSNCR